MGKLEFLRKAIVPYLIKSKLQLRVIVKKGNFYKKQGEISQVLIKFSMLYFYLGELKSSDFLK